MKPLRLFTFHLLFLIAGLVFLSTGTWAEDKLKTTAVATRPSQASHVIYFVNGHLTVKVEDVSLQELLHQIARQSGLTIVRSGALEDPITIEFHRVPLVEGLRRILHDQSIALVYAQQKTEGTQSTIGRLKELWILPEGKEDYPVQGTLVTDTPGRDVGPGRAKLQAALTNEDPWEREKAVDALGEGRRLEAIKPLSLALEDPEEDVREAAIAALANIGGDEAVQALSTALQDENSSLREESIEALGEIGGESAIVLLEQALADEDESVRETAAELLAQLKDEPRLHRTTSGTNRF